MIVSHKHKFIFIKTRKTAGTSLEVGLSALCGENDIIPPLHPQDEEAKQQGNYPGPQNYLVPYKYYSMRDVGRLLVKQKRKQYYEHMPASELKQYLSPEQWNSYFKFTIERNPFDKVVSHYFWVDGPRRFTTFRNFALSRAILGAKAWEMYTINGRIVVDKVFKYEDLSKLPQELSETLALSSTFNLPSIRFKGNRRPTGQVYQDLIDDESKGIISDLFAMELKTFHYSF